MRINKMVLAAVVMAVSLVPFLFDEEDVGVVPTQQCGEDVYWEISGNVLTLTGTGPMYDYGSSSAPWASASISRIVVESGITSISNGAFRGMDSVVSVTIPSTVQSIGSRAFYGMSSLGLIHVPSGVTSIGESAYQGCTQVTEILFESRSCRDFTSTTSPFSGVGTGASTLSVTISNGARVPAYLFYNCTQVDYITLERVSSIGNYAFSGCTGDIDATSLSNTSSIGQNAFQGCTGLGAIVIPSAVTSIATNAFSGCTAVSSISYAASGVRNLTASPFVGVGTSSSSVSVTFASGLTAIPNYMFASTASNFNFGQIPSSVRTIGTYAFANSSGSLSLGESNNVSQIGSNAFYGSMVSEVVLNSVTSIGDRAFAECNNLGSITFSSSHCKDFDADSQVFSGNNATFSIGSNVKDLPDYILYNTRGISTVTGGDGLTEVGRSAFENCSAILEISTQNLKTINPAAFKNSGLKTIVLGPSLSTVYGDSFSGCELVSTVTLNNNSLHDLFNENNSILRSVGGDSGVKVIITSDVTAVPNYFIDGNGNVTDVELSNVSSIGTAAFRGTSVGSLLFPESVEKIGDYAFYGTSKLRTVTFESFYTQIGNSAFYITGDNVDLNINCYRKAVQNDYDWRGDNREPKYSWWHLAGEYGGMMEVLFNVGSLFLGGTITNNILDFFIDNYSLNVLESIDMGSTDGNYLLLIAISILLTIILFVLLYTDRNNAVRLMESILTFVGVFVFLFSIIRYHVEVMENTPLELVIAAFFILGLYYPLKATYIQVRKKQMPREGETLVRLFTLDRKAFLDMAFFPLKHQLSDLLHFRLVAFICFTGFLLSAVYLLCFIIFHIPPFLISWILSKVYVRMDSNCHKHTLKSVCPVCGKRIVTAYACTSCGQIHKRLVPGMFGLNRATCGGTEKDECGAKIPCRVHDRRWTVATAMCPECNRKIENWESEPFSIAVVGGSGVGKSSLIAGSLVHLSEDCSGLESKFVGPAHSAQLPVDASNLVSMYRSGSAIISNPDRSVPFTVLLDALYKNKDFITGKAFHYYEVGGEANPQGSYSFLEDLEGIVFVINPMELQTSNPRANISNDPSSILSRFLNTYRAINQMELGEKVKVPIAVVVNHVDSLSMSRFSIGDLDSATRDAEIRNMLTSDEYGLINFVKMIDNEFTEVRYFVCESTFNAHDAGLFYPSLWIAEKASRYVRKYLE